MKHFWRSYSFVLTFICVLFVCLFSAFSVDVSSSSDEILPGEVEALDNARASGQIFVFYNGLLYQWNTFSWRLVSWVNNINKKPSFTVDQSQAQWQWFAEASGISLASSGGGGMTLNEFSGYFGTWSDQKLNQLFKDYFYYRPVFDQYLDADGQIKTLVSTSGMPDEFYLSSLVSLGLRGLRSVMLDNASANHLDLTSGFAANHKDLDALLSKLTAVNTNVISFKNMNHTDLISGFSTNHTDLTSGFSTNHADLEAVRRQIMNSFDYQNSNYLYGNLFSGPSDVSLGSFLVGADGKASFSPWNSSTGEIGGTFYGYGLGGLIAELGMPMQYDLAKLRYVLASDQDIEISKKNEPVKDAIEDNFVGDAPGAVKPDSVGDMAGISGGLQDSLNTGANAGDVLGFLNGSEGWGFWSQEVANGLHNVPASTADDEVSIYYGDIDSFEDLSFEDFAGIDFIHFYDPSALDNYLSRGDVS